jgi:hypothetical protein
MCICTFYYSCFNWTAQYSLIVCLDQNKSESLRKSSAINDNAFYLTHLNHFLTNMNLKITSVFWHTDFIPYSYFLWSTQTLYGWSHMSHCIESCIVAVTNHTRCCFLLFFFYILMSINNQLNRKSSTLEFVCLSIHTRYSYMTYSSHRNNHVYFNYGYCWAILTRLLLYSFFLGEIQLARRDCI